MDLLNPFFKISDKSKIKLIPEKISKIVNKNMNNNSKNKNYSFVRESRIVSFSLFLIIMKYQSFLINYSKTILNDKTGENLIREAFAPLISLSQNEIQFLLTNIGKVKENKNFEIIMEKEESRSKEFKDYNKNYYKSFLEKLKMKNFDVNSIKNEIQAKFETDEYQRYKKAKSEIYDLTANLGGIISGEHGIGADKKEAISKVVSRIAIDYMREIKRVFDPENILNPYKIF